MIIIVEVVIIVVSICVVIVVVISTVVIIDTNQIAYASYRLNSTTEEEYCIGYQTLLHLVCIPS